MILLTRMLSAFTSALFRPREKQVEEPQEEKPATIADLDPQNLLGSEDMTEAAAIHRAAEVINDRIQNGEIRTHEELRKAVLDEVAFQTIVINEETP